MGSFAPAHSPSPSFGGAGRRVVTSGSWRVPSAILPIMTRNVRRAEVSASARSSHGRIVPSFRASVSGKISTSPSRAKGEANGEGISEIEGGISENVREENVLATSSGAYPDEVVQEVVSAHGYEIKLDPQRWVQLGILSLLAMLSDWTCFAFVASPDVYEKAAGHSPEELIDLFLITNVLGCMLVTDVTSRYGLKRVLRAGALTMTIGCLLRAGMPGSTTLPPYAVVQLGTVLVGLSQPLFQCTPPLLSQTWFGNKERALSTAVAINFNQVGIAMAFLTGGFIVHESTDLPLYLGSITAVSAVVTGATWLLFRERPSAPPSASAAVEWNSTHTPDGQKIPPSETPRWEYPGLALQLFRTPGFVYAFVAFVTSISISNVVSSFNMPNLLRAGFEQAETVAINATGIGFQLAIVFGGIFVGGYVDRTKRFKGVTLALISISIGLLAILGVAEGYNFNVDHPIVILTILLLGAALGPIQPINAELGVEVSYPMDENAVEATQQLGGNLFSALLIPICASATQFDGIIPEWLDVSAAPEDIRGDSLILLALATGCLAFFRGFNSPLAREEADGEDARQADILDLVDNVK